jgi:anti-sigma B factor antagonist
MNTKCDKIGDVIVITLIEPRFTNMHASEFRDKMQSLIDEGNSNFVINLEKVNYMDSSGLGAIISSNNYVQDYNEQNETSGKIVISGMNKTVEVLFSLLKVNKLMKIFPDKQTAIESFNSN